MVMALRYLHTSSVTVKAFGVLLHYWKDVEVLVLKLTVSIFQLYGVICLTDRAAEGVRCGLH